jgi:hypothetical protein
MSLVDTTFAGIPAPLLNQWGQNLKYIKAGDGPVYDPTTGEVCTQETEIPIKGIITEANPEEFEGFYQTSDLKVIIGNAELDGHYPSIRDRIQYNEASTTRVGRIINSKTYRGDSPVLHILLVRPQ